MKGTDLNKSSEKAHRPESRNMLTVELLVVLSPCSQVQLYLPDTDVRPHAQGVASGEAYSSFGVQSLCGVQSCKPDQVLLWLI